MSLLQPKVSTKIKSNLKTYMVTAATVTLSALTIIIFQAASAPTQSSADTETTFTLAEVPDTQQEVLSDTNPLMADRYRWLSDNQQALNLKFIAHTGDVVNAGHVDPIQFIRASNATTILDNSGVPYSLAIGNHDGAAVNINGSAAPGNTRTNLRNTADFNQTFPLSRYKNVAGTFEPSKVDNIYQTFSAGGVDWLVLTMEMWPRQTVVDWAKQVVASHPHHNVIISTHAYVDGNGTYPTTGNYGDLNAQQVWQQLISQYPNIKFTVSGHYGPTSGFGGYNYTEAIGVNGNKIAQIMTAYHSSCQNHVRLLKIDTANNSINSSIYVPTSTSTSCPKGYITDSASNFLASDMNWIRPETPAPQPEPQPTPTAEPTVTAPSAPTNVTASAGNANAQISFSTPLSDGGTPITRYTVTSNPGNITANGYTSPITVNGLANGTTYTFTVTATNSAGTSSASTASNNITPSAPISELLSDPGFESGNGGWIAFSSGTLTRITNQVRSGRYAMQVTYPSTNATNLIGLTHNSVVSNSIAGKIYSFQCYVRPVGTSPNLSIRFLEYTQNYSTNIKIGTVSVNNLPANTWTLMKVTGTAVNSGERIIPQIYSGNQTAANGSFIYDDCSVTAN